MSSPIMEIGKRHSSRFDCKLKIAWPLLKRWTLPLPQVSKDLQKLFDHIFDHVFKYSMQLID